MADGPPLAIPPGAVRCGPGVLDEVGHDARALGLASVLVLTDAALHDAGVAGRAVASLERAGAWSETLVAPVSEPTDAIVGELVGAASAGRYDGVVAVGGGSVIDIAKIAGLLLTSGGAAVDYVNPPFGDGRPPSRPPLPLIAVPTTAGSGSESSAVAVLELVDQGVKTAISHPALRPALALADATTTVTLPPRATAAAALDVLAHALESLTSRPRDERPAGVPGARPAYVGANPYSSGLCEAALPTLARGIVAVRAAPTDLRARCDLMEASTLSALGAAVAGSHVGHACAYAIAGRAPGVAHGFAAAVMLPALMRATFDRDPAGHLRYAEALAAPLEVDLDALAPRERLPAAVRAALVALDAPLGLRDLGLGPDDLPEMARAAASQQRLMAGAPIPMGVRELEELLADALDLGAATGSGPAARTAGRPRG